MLVVGGETDRQTDRGRDRRGRTTKKRLGPKACFFDLFYFLFFSARLERNELWNCDFPFFVLFNIKPYLLYWKLQRLLSLMISEFHKAHIKVSLQNTSSCLDVIFLSVCSTSTVAGPFTDYRLRKKIISVVC